MTAVRVNRWDGQQWVPLGDPIDMTDEQVDDLRTWAESFNRTTTVAREIAVEAADAGRWQAAKVEHVSLIWVWHNGLFKCGEQGMTQGNMHRIISEGNAQVLEWYDRETNTVTTETPECYKGWGSCR